MTQPYSRALRRALTACFIISFGFVITISVLLQASNDAVKDSVEWVVHTGTVLEAANDLQDRLKNPAERGAQLRRLRELTLDNPIQQDELVALEEHFRSGDEDGSVTAGMRVLRAREIRLLNTRLITFRDTAARSILWRRILFWGTLFLLIVLGIAVRRMFMHHEDDAQKTVAQAQAVIKQINLMLSNNHVEEQRAELEKVKEDMNGIIQKLSRESK